MIENLDRPLAATDPEAGWCGRADGEKWDPMAVQKYFEGDMHRGPNGSRKPVEILLGILLIRDFAVNAVRRKWSEYALTIKPGQYIVDILKSQWSNRHCSVHYCWSSFHC